MSTIKIPIKGLTCLNCEYPLQGNENFCPECGQQNDIRRVSVKEMISHFLGGFFAFDNLFFRTLKPLLFQPGKVTKEFLEGKRKKYTNPFIFLLHSAIVFLLMSGIFSAISDYGSLKNDMSEQQQRYLYQQKVHNTLNQSETINLLRNDSISTSEKTKLLQNIYNDTLFRFDKNKPDGLIKVDFNNQIRYERISFIQQEIDKYDIPYLVLHKNDSVYLEEKKSEFSVKDNKFAKMIDALQLNDEMATLEALKKYQIEPTTFNIYIFEKFKKLNKTFKIDKDADSIIDAVLSKIPMALFFMLPLFTLTFSLLYYKHYYKYTEHLITVFNIQSAFFWLMTFSGFIELFYNDEDIPIKFVLIIMLVYIYKTLRKVYQQNRLITIVKLILVNLSYIITAGIGFLVLLGISLILV